jgi:hypothetical protein
MADDFNETRKASDDEEGDYKLDDPKEPKGSKGWLAMLAHARRQFEAYHDKCDSIDKLFADLERMAALDRSREFQMFWANIQVLGPSIYSRPPVPAVTARFNNNDPVVRNAAEFLERSVAVAFDMTTIDDVMKHCRDDLVMSARAVPWVTYEPETKPYESVCIVHTDRRDFLHEPARYWYEVGWVAKRAFLTKREARKRFQKHSGDLYQKAAYEIQKDENGNDNGLLKAGFWEIWSKTQNKVVWVSEGCDQVLDQGKPHLKLEGFFPCPRPAYSTLQRRTLIPVPDFVFYKDQLEEINELTNRIAALSEALKVRGFYPAGMGDISDAIEAAMKSTLPNQVLVPVSDWAMMGDQSLKDMIVWVPLADIAQAITGAVAIRKQLIEDVYQITGMSDIMRGATDPNETLGAQQLKSQYGSIRIRDRQEELIRMARDLVRIVAEIMAEEFSPKTLASMAQMDLMTDSDVRKQIAPLDAQLLQITRDIKAAQSDPEVAAMAQQDPEKAQQVIEAAKAKAGEISQQIDELQQTVTLEQVTDFLQDEKIRPFILDIETDSTIAPDENAQKQRVTEYLGAMGSLLSQALPAVQQLPQAAPMLAEMIRFAQKQFRVGRSMDQVVDEFATSMQQLAQQPPPDPNAGEKEKQAAEVAEKQMRAQSEAQRNVSEGKAKELEGQAKVQETGAKAQSEAVSNAERVQALQAKDAADKQALADKQAMAEQERVLAKEKHDREMEKIALDIEAKRLDVEAKRQARVTELMGQGIKSVPGEPSEEGGEPVESLINIADERQAETNAIMAAVAQGLAALAEAQAAPKQIAVVRDAQGRMIGAKEL